MANGLSDAHHLHEQVHALPEGEAVIGKGGEANPRWRHKTAADPAQLPPVREELMWLDGEDGPDLDLVAEELHLAHVAAERERSRALREAEVTRREREEEWQSVTDDPDVPLELLIPILAALMCSDDSDEVGCAVMRLALAVDTEEIDASVLGTLVRDNFGLDALVGILRNPTLSESVIQAALLVLGNLGSDAVDPQAELTRDRLRALNAYDDFLYCLHAASADETTLIYALGAVQNICAIDPCFANECARDGALINWMRGLAHSSENERVQHYARGCIQNIDSTLEHAVAVYEEG
uniref:Nucleotide exchange factor Fes1 domain-containing protein n=1 Tax=Haptolina ericina TaxID=156174 RepID=A0A7S3EW26_9EUKA